MPAARPAPPAAAAGPPAMATDLPVDWAHARSSAQPKRPAQPGSRGQHSTTVSDVISLAGRRGRDWGLPDVARGAVPVTRPVFVVCHVDRLVVLAEEGAGDGKEIPVAARTQDSVDQLVSSV